MKLKFNNIRDLSDARYASAMMADWIGFSVGSQDSLSVAQIAEILGWCSGPLCVLELSPGADPALLEAYANAFGVQGIEMTEADYWKWKDLEFLKGKDIIVQTETHEFENTITHRRHTDFRENHLCRFSEVPENEDFPGELWGMSLDCFDAENPALKNYDDWNDFFEFIGRI